MTTSTTITVDASKYEDHDDRLAAAAADHIARRPALAGWDLAPRWVEDDAGEDAIELTIPLWSLDATDDQIEQLRRHAVNDVTRDIAAVGLRLTHEQADDLGEEVLAWARRRLGVMVETEEEWVTLTPGGVVVPESSW